MKIIDPEIFYKILITGEENNPLNEYSLNSSNTELDANGNLYNKFNLKIFNLSGNWLEQQINLFNTQDDENETIYGNFNYLSTVLDESSYILPQYTEIFKIEVLVPEKLRSKFIPFFDKYAANFNNLEGSYDNNDLYIRLGEHSTPVYENKQDIGGMERFKASFSILIRVTSAAITTKNIKLEVYTDASNLEEIKYISFNLKRESDLNLDNTAGNTKKYDVQKTDISAALGCLYVNNYLSRSVFEYLINEDIERELKIKYTDLILNISKDFNFYIGSANVNYQYGQPVSYTITLKLKFE